VEKGISKTETQKKIEEFFQRSEWNADEMRKIKNLAMRHRIKLLAHKKKFCRKCLLPLKGKTRVSKLYKVILCEKCGYSQKMRIG